ncbi:hypothetical protein AB0442_22950 [Kitasatospora sp. NPDC085895]|uniref:hypothetical protein n=1 Tax=Kitasatospora sp. NPDC085895 TaxID=3155057 RepID=UPI0034500DA7
MTTVVQHRSDQLAADESAALTDELRALVRKGLPLGPATGAPRLTALATVAARAGDGAEPAARTEALDWVLRRTLARLDPEGLREAAKALFGLPPARAGANLTERREAAAAAAGREVHHFRKRIEPQILAALAHALQRDAAVQARPWASPPPVRPGTGRRVLPSDVFAWEAVEHEEALTRLWAAVYALRAELLAVERLTSMGDMAEATAEADTALWRYGHLHAEARRYQAAYGGALLPDQAAAPHDLIALAGWTPRLPQADTALLADAATATSAHLFMLSVHAAPGGTALLTAWRTALTGTDHTDTAPASVGQTSVPPGTGPDGADTTATTEETMR